MRKLLNTLFVLTESSYLDPWTAKPLWSSRGMPKQRGFRCTPWKASSAFPTRAPPLL